MSWQATSAVKEHMRGEEPVVKLLAFVLADYANPEGDDIFPSIATLADQVGVSERTVQRHLERLQEIGFIKRVGNSRGGAMRKDASGKRRGRTNRYRIDLEWWKRYPVKLTGLPSETPSTGAVTPTNGADKGDTALSPEESIEDSISGARSHEAEGSELKTDASAARQRLTELAEAIRARRASSMVGTPAREPGG